jgi:hypothetical protein
VGFGVSFTRYGVGTSAIDPFQLKRFLRIQVNIPLRKRDNQPGFSKQVVDAEAHTTFNGTPLDDFVNLNPEKDVENECIVAKVMKKYKRLRFFDHPVVFLDRFEQQASGFLDR